MAVNSAHAQGRILLDNYATVGPYVTYGAGSGGTVGTGIEGAQWTVGFYWGLGNITVPSDPSGTADPGVLSGGALQLASGDNTSGYITYLIGRGSFASIYTAVLPGDTSGLVTLEVVAYDGLNYDASSIRGHSDAFTMTPPTSGYAPAVGLAMPGFSVFSVPEPSAFALCGIGIAALLVRRLQCDKPKR
jgi:hypothetical protein